MKIPKMFQAKGKLIGAYFILIVSTALYIYLNYSSVENGCRKKNNEQIISMFYLYEKMFRIYGSGKDILIENKNYIENNDLIEEFSKSTPLPIDKKNKRSKPYTLTFKYIAQKENLPPIFGRSRALFKDKPYFIKYRDGNAYLLGKLDTGSYIFITKNMDNNITSRKLFYFFINVMIFAVINLGLFIYLLYRLKKDRESKIDMELEYSYLQEETKKIAFEDKLTKAASRLKFEETLKDLIQISSRFEEQKFCLIILDIDNFKRVNDTFGHDYGDVVLKKVAGCIKTNTRSSDTFARWGGEEFVLILPMCRLEEGAAFAQKLRKFISNIPFEKIENITCSFGVVEFTPEDNEKSLLKRADLLLYKAKEKGKNRVEF